MDPIRVLLVEEHPERVTQVREALARLGPDVVLVVATALDPSPVAYDVLLGDAAALPAEHVGQLAQAAAQAAVRQRRESGELRRLMESAPIGIIIRRGPTIVFANRAVADSFDIADEKSLIGRDLAELFDSSIRDSLGQRWRDVDVGAIDQPAQARFVRGDGRPGVMEMTTSGTVSFAGAPSVMVLLRDITHENQLRDRVLMSERLAAVGTLAAGVAHEINNPLACVTANLEVIDEELTALAQLPAVTADRADRADAARIAELRAALADAREGAERVRVIVRDLRLFARSDDHEHGPVDVSDAVDVAARMTANLMRGRARLVKDLAHLPPVDANAPRLAQVFVNLLVNAAQAIDPGAPDKNSVEIRGRTVGERVVIEVRDSGRGMSDELRRRIFDPFFSTHGAGGGPGLGLAVCHGIVSGLGGEITVDSTAGSGSCFRVSLPIARA